MSDNNKNIKAIISILEDDRIQIETIKEAAAICLPNCIFRLGSDGKELLRLLMDEPPPNVLILDINTPVLSGWDVLRMVRDRSDLDWLPIVMFSTDDSTPTRVRANKMRATALEAKPIGLDSSEMMGEALVNIVKKYAVSDDKKRSIIRPVLNESLPFSPVNKKSINDMLGDL